MLFTLKRDRFFIIWDNRQTCPLLWCVTCLYFPKALRYRYILEKIVCKNDRKCLCSQDVEEWNGLMENSLLKQNLTKTCLSSRYLAFKLLHDLRGLLHLVCQGNGAKVAAEGPEYLKRVWHFYLLYWVTVGGWGRWIYTSKIMLF